MTEVENKAEVTAKAAMAKLILGFIASLFLFWYFLGGGLEEKVANDCKKEYYMAVRSGDRTDICVHAGLVAAAYQQAHDEENYETWKRTEQTDCAYMQR